MFSSANDCAEDVTECEGRRTNGLRLAAPQKKNVVTRARTRMCEIPHKMHKLYSLYLTLATTQTQTRTHSLLKQEHMRGVRGACVSVLAMVENGDHG